MSTYTIPVGDNPLFELEAYSGERNSLIKKIKKLKKSFETLNRFQLAKPNLKNKLVSYCILYFSAFFGKSLS